MFKEIIQKTKRMTNGNYGSVILEELTDSFGRETKIRLKELSEFTDNLSTTKAIHLAIDNLTNAKSVVQKILPRKDLINSEVAITLIEEQIEQTNLLLQNIAVANSSQATEIGIKTLNYLFGAKQKVKQHFSLITKIKLPEIVNGNESENLLPEAKQKLLPSTTFDIPRLIISSRIIYQMKHSLFPAEKMLVGAGHRIGQDVVIDAVFDVTGQASEVGVKADSALLDRALISMSLTESYFALWIHSHPGIGVSATFPSQTDLNQEKDWLRDYSKDLVNAIMVKDGILRFWGKALQNEQIAVSVEGTGLTKISENEHIYKLDY